nr:hypothetical protein [uncultured Flavobacterium sp.]
MEVKFDTVRIGKIRSGSIEEKILEQNLGLLKSNVQLLLKDDKVENKHNRIGIVLVIPAKGYNIKIAVQYTSNEFVKKLLSLNFPDSIYKGRYSTIDENVLNQVHAYR